MYIVSPCNEKVNRKNTASQLKEKVPLMVATLAFPEIYTNLLNWWMFHVSLTLLALKFMANFQKGGIRSVPRYLCNLVFQNSAIKSPDTTGKR